MKFEDLLSEVHLDIYDNRLVVTFMPLITVKMSEIKLTERQQYIISLIKNVPTINVKQMSEIMSVNKRTVERDLTHLKKIGKLMREGSNKDGIWVVI